MPVFGTIASQFNDPGTNSLYKAIIDKFNTTEINKFLNRLLILQIK